MRKRRWQSVEFDMSEHAVVVRLALLVLKSEFRLRNGVKNLLWNWCKSTVLGWLQKSYIMNILLDNIYFYINSEFHLSSPYCVLQILTIFGNSNLYTLNSNSCRFFFFFGLSLEQSQNTLNIYKQHETDVFFVHLLLISVVGYSWILQHHRCPPYRTTIIAVSIDPAVCTTFSQIRKQVISWNIC